MSYKLCIVLLFVSFSISAQDNLMYIDNDSVRTMYETAIEKQHVLKPASMTISEKEAVKIIDRMPAFGVFRDIYFITGIPLNERITKESADASFQISIRHRLTKSVLPYNTFAYVTYTQKSFWDIYSKSSPFRDINYNPGIGIGKAIIYNGHLTGSMFLQIQHESNGRDEEESRSWNFISFAANYYLNPLLKVSGQVWIPYVDGDHNQDLLDYKGFGYASVDVATNKYKWWFSAKLNPRKGFGNVNTEFTAAFKISTKSNQYIYARIYNGYGESLLDYDKYMLNVKIGFCIKPDFFNIY